MLIGLYNLASYHYESACCVFVVGGCLGFALKSWYHDLVNLKAKRKATTSTLSVSMPPSSIPPQPEFSKIVFKDA